MIPTKDIQKTLAFSREEYEGRMAKVRLRMVDRGIDVFLIHTPENICYLSGYHTPGYYKYQVLILPLEKEPVLITRLIEQTNVFAFSWFDTSVPYTDTEDPVKLTVETLKEMGLTKGKIGIEESGWFLPVDTYQELEGLLHEAELVDGSGIVEKERAVKSPAEIEYIRQAAHVAVVGMQAAAEHIRAGVTEQKVAGQVYKAMVEIGGEYAGLPVFLSSGHRTWIVHAIWSNKVIEPGDNVYLELAGTVMRYAAPFFRTFYVGQPPDRVGEISVIVKDMLEQVIDTIRPGVSSHEVDAAAKKAAVKAGFGEGVKKRAGYSVGINFPPDWGEGHFLELNENDPTILEPGMVFHLPQSIRVENIPPVAMSETVLVTEDGHEILTGEFPRQLIVV